MGNWRRNGERRQKHDLSKRTKYIEPDLRGNGKIDRPVTTGDGTMAAEKVDQNLKKADVGVGQGKEKKIVKRVVQENIDN